MTTRDDEYQCRFRGVFSDTEVSPFFHGSKKVKIKKMKMLPLASCSCACLFYNEKSRKYKNAFLGIYTQKYNNREL